MWVWVYVAAHIAVTPRSGLAARTQVPRAHAAAVGAHLAPAQRPSLSPPSLPPASPADHLVRWYTTFISMNLMLRSMFPFCM